MSCCRKEKLKIARAWAGVDYFEYTGSTGMTVQGGFTKRIYRFDRPGARMAVDARDTASMRAVPRLRLLRG